MTTLEKRFYPRQEIAEIVGITNLKDKHFAEKVKRYLDNRKYGYDYSRKGVSITVLPETAEEQLASMLRNSLGLDIQVDAYHFACFINAFSAIKGFDAMPWITRTAIFNQHYHNTISKPTLERWYSHLVESGNMTKFAKGALWRTFKDDDGYIVQKRVEPDSQEYQEYCEKRKAFLTGSGFESADKATRKNTWGSMVYTLLPEYGVYYYCPSSILNALGNQAEEISRLVAQVMAEKQEAEKEHDEP